MIFTNTSVTNDIATKYSNKCNILEFNPIKSSPQQFVPSAIITGMELSLVYV